MYDLYQGVEISTYANSTYSNYYNGSSELIGSSGPKGPPGENGNFSKDELSIFSTLGMSLTGFGKNWEETTNNLPYNSFSSVSLSASGKYQTAITDVMTQNNADMYLYVSSDFGNTWNGVQSIPKIVFNYLSLSASGQYQTAVALGTNPPPIYGDFIYVSSDFGVTWTKSNSLKNMWYCVSLSASGQYQTAVAKGIQAEDDRPPGDFIYVSSDFGVTWTSKSLQKIFTSVSLSASGQYQTAVAENDEVGDFIYVSNDFGENWTQLSAPQKQWKSVSLSASGQYQTAVALGIPNPGEPPFGFIYVSIDFGNTWTPSNSPEKQWNGVSVSGSGQHITACCYEPDIPNLCIYTSKSFPPQS